MSLDLTQKVQTTFDLAIMRHEAKRIEQKRMAQKAQIPQSEKGKDWEQIRTITKQHNINLRSVRNRLDQQSISIAQRVDRFAKRDVRNDHERRLQSINEHELKELTTLIETSKQRDELERDNDQGQSQEAPTLPRLLTDERGTSGPATFTPSR